MKSSEGGETPGSLIGVGQERLQLWAQMNGSNSHRYTTPSPPSVPRTQELGEDHGLDGRGRGASPLPFANGRC